jgi:hypothetical protein
MIIVIPIAVMNPVVHANYVGHFTGFLCGILTPFVLTAARKK